MFKLLSNKEIGLRIKTVREEKGMTLQEVADKVGIAKSTVQRYEAGSIEKIKLPVISSIAKVLDVNPAWLIGKSDEKTDSGEYELKDAYFNFAKELQEKKVPKEDLEKLWKFYEMIKNL